MKFVWNGWQDAYEYLNVPTLLDEKGIVWQGSYYYSGSDSIWSNREKVRKELQEAVKIYNVIGYDFSSDDISDWNVEDKRKWNG